MSDHSQHKFNWQKGFAKRFIPGIAWFFIVLYLMTIPGKELPEVGWLDKIYFDKWVHAGLFAVMVFLFCWPFNRSSFIKPERYNYFIRIAIASCLWGLTIEFIQKFFIPGRSFDLWDWAADSIGVLMGYVVSRRYFSV
ncbi:MAG: VanZ family protein [Chitinophagaceae bacterium]|nr:VanZ family protein [Chitinophagaceae bacterium]